MGERVTGLHFPESEPKSERVPNYTKEPGLLETENSNVVIPETSSTTHPTEARSSETQPEVKPHQSIDFKAIPEGDPTEIQQMMDGVFEREINNQS